jgi:hypothetical protein
MEHPAPLKERNQLDGVQSYVFVGIKIGITLSFGEVY